MDLAAPYGEPVYSAGNGRVISAGYSPGYGRTVHIHHGGGYSTLYAHMSRILVRKGETALGECVEVHYRTRGKWYFGIGFRNRKGGLEIRNPYFKGSTSPKDITHLRHGAGGNGKATALVFEGFMDYLSYLTLKQGKPVPDCVVLNSVGNLPGALDVLKGYGHVCCFLDNDDAGRKTTEEIRRQCGSVTDKAVHYLPHKDLNEFLQHRLKKAEEPCAELKQGSG